MEHESSLTPSQAPYVIERLLADRRITPADIHRYLMRLADEIRDIQARLEVLWDAAPIVTVEAPRSPASRQSRVRGSAGRRTRQARPPVAAPEAIASALAPLPRERRKRRQSSPAVRAKMRILGSYVGYIRQVAAAKRPHFQRLARQQGYEAAIKAIRTHLHK
jgi:hypothetical protein